MATYLSIFVYKIGQHKCNFEFTGVLENYTLSAKSDLREMIASCYLTCCANLVPNYQMMILPIVKNVSSR